MFGKDFGSSPTTAAINSKTTLDYFEIKDF